MSKILNILLSLLILLYLQSNALAVSQSIEPNIKKSLFAKQINQSIKADERGSRRRATVRRRHSGIVVRRHHNRVRHHQVRRHHYRTIHGRHMRLFAVGAGIAIVSGAVCYVSNHGMGSIVHSNCCVHGSCYSNFYVE